MMMMMVLLLLLLLLTLKKSHLLPEIGQGGSRTYLTDRTASLWYKHLGKHELSERIYLFIIYTQQIQQKKNVIKI